MILHVIICNNFLCSFSDLENEANQPARTFKDKLRRQSIRTDIYRTKYDIPIQLQGDERICHQVIADIEGYGKFKVNHRVLES